MAEDKAKPAKLPKEKAGGNFPATIMFIMAGVIISATLSSFLTFKMLGTNMVRQTAQQVAKKMAEDVPRLDEKSWEITPIGDFTTNTASPNVFIKVSLSAKMALPEEKGKKKERKGEGASANDPYAKFIPVMKDASLGVLNALTFNDIHGNLKALLATRIKDALNQALGEPAVLDVYVTDLAYQE